MKPIYSLGYTFSVKSFAFILNYIVISSLLLKEYGSFSLIFSTLNSVIVVTCLGLLYSANIFTSRWIGKNNNYIFNYFKFSFYLIFFLSLLFSVVLYYSYGYFFSSFFIILIFSTSTLLEGFLYGIGEIKKLFIYGFLNLVLALALSFFFVKNMGLDGAVLSLAFSRFLLFIFQLRYFFVRIENDGMFKVKYLKSIILFYKKYNIPLLMSALIATPVVTLVIYILSIQRGLEEVAIFSWCYQIYLLGMFIPTALGAYYLSVLNRKDHKNKLIVMKQITKFNLLVSALAILFLFVMSKFILTLGNIESFKQSYSVYYAFLFCMFFYSLNLGYLSFWSSVGKNAFYFKIQILWSALLIVFVLAFVGNLGALAIPIGMTAGFIVQYLIQNRAIGSY
ncbi:hypothetical protein VXR69_05875 [Acinetobacter baumannii]|uniref:hypothetical protein n=1 Tax=Acinetobacter baumannii TaxID=470 RepID=UPI0037DEA623